MAENVAEKLLLRIEADGTIVGLSGSGIEEVLDLRSLGHVTAERAAHIKFDEASQTWGWIAADGSGSGGGYRTRREAVAAEYAAMSKRL